MELRATPLEKTGAPSIEDLAKRIVDALSKSDQHELVRLTFPIALLQNCNVSLVTRGYPLPRLMEFGVGIPRSVKPNTSDDEEVPLPTKLLGMLPETRTAVKDAVSGKGWKLNEKVPNPGCRIQTTVFHVQFKVALRNKKQGELGFEAVRAGGRWYYWGRPKFGIHERK